MPKHNNRQFALSVEPDHVSRSNGCIIDDDTCRLNPCLGGLGHYIVKGGCCDLCNPRDIVEKSDQSDAQGVFALCSGHGER
jgi:hypothetical protein